MNFSTKHIDQFVAGMQTTTFAAGDVIFSKGDSYDYCYMILSGIAGVYVYDDKGVVRRIMPFKEYQFFPSDLADMGDKILTREYGAYTDLVCVRFNQADIARLKKSPEALFEITLAMSQLVEQAKSRIETLIHPGAEMKMLFLFKYMLEISGEPTDNPDLIAIGHSNLSQSKIGASLGLTRETTGKTIAGLMEKGILYIQNKKYIVDKPKLLARIEPSSKHKPKRNLFTA